MRIVTRLLGAALAVLLGVGAAHAQTYPSPTFNNVTAQGNATIGGTLGFSGLGYLSLPSWTAAPNSNAGTVGFNSTTGPYEFGTGGAMVNHVRLSGDTMTGALGFAQQSAPSAPSTGGALYVDSSNVLHYKNAGYDFPLAGAEFNGSAQPWWIVNNGLAYGFGDPAAPANEFAVLRSQKVITSGTGGSGIAGNLYLSTIKGGGSGPELALPVKAYAATGATTLVIQDNASAVAVGVAPSGAGLAAGTTFSAVSHSTPSSGQATVTLSAPIGSPIYPGQTISIGNSPMTETETTITANCDDYGGTPASGVGCMAFIGGAARHTLGGGAFGMNLVASDLTGRKSSVAGAVTTGEFDLRASGPDDGCYCAGTNPYNIAGNRHAFDVIPYSNGASIDGATGFEAGYQLRGGGMGSVYDPDTVRYGYLSWTANGPLNVTNAFATDGAPAGQAAGLLTFAGTLTIPPTSTSASGSNTLTFGTIPVQVGQYVSDTGGCVPAGTTVLSVTPNTALTSYTATLSANLTCNVTSADSITFTNWFVDGWQASGFYSDAFANLTNAGATGVIKLGSTLSTGNIASLNFQGQNSGAVVASYGALNWNVMVNTAGSERGQAMISLPNSGDLNAGSGNSQSGGNDMVLGSSNGQTGSNQFLIGYNSSQSTSNEWGIGAFNIQSGSNSVALGFQAKDFGLYGALCHANGEFSTQGDAENCTVNLRAATTTTTATRLTADAGAAGSANTLNLPSGSAAALKITVVATDVTSKGNVGTWDVALAALSRSGAASTTAYSGATPAFQSIGGAAPASTAIVFAADTTDGGLSITWTAPNTDTWHVVARVQAEMTQ